MHIQNANDHILLSKATIAIGTCFLVFLNVYPKYKFHVLAHMHVHNYQQ